MFKRHGGTVYSATFSPDGRSLASGSEDCSVRVWNIRDGSSKKLPVTKDASFFVSVVFSPDGRYIAAGDLRHQLWIWDSRTHRLMASWMGHSDCVWCVKFTPDGKGLMSGGDDGVAKYWDLSSLGIHEAGRAVVTSFPLIQSFSGYTVSFVVSSSWLTLLSFPQDRINSIAFFPGNSESVITGSGDGSVRIWNTRTGFWELIVRHTNSVEELDVSGAECFLAIAGANHVTLWTCDLL